MADGQVVFEISADGRKATAAIEDITKALEKAGRNWEGTASNASNSMQKSFSKAFDIERVKNWALQAAKAVAGFAKEAIGAASDLEEVQNVVDTTFGQSAAVIDSWAKNAIKNFGLSETKAKQFASTMGAMLKSSGLQGNEIVQMSEDLAGLAADMASFYNLDFDTAFQKIRSGISGETEPLKQLGINMSVANLEAFRLAQGIDKAYASMTQAEQTSLRYQYIMQATADAQGDFARTSDGYANSLRLLEGNIDRLKTTLGSTFLDVVAGAVGALNGFLELLMPTEKKTVLDTFAEIDSQLSAKLAEIEDTAGKASDLVGVLEEINGTTFTSTSLTSFVETLSGSLTGLDNAMEAARRGNYEGTISGIADALELKTGVDAEKWRTLLSAIGDKLPDAIKAAEDGGDFAPFLTAAAQAAEELGGEYPDLWKQLLETLGTNVGPALSALADGKTGADTMKTLAAAINAVDTTKTGLSTFVETLSGKFGGLGDALDRAKESNYKGTISEVAGALADSTGIDAGKWENLLTVIGEKLPEAAAKAAESGDLAPFLEAAAQAASELGGEYPDLWQTLLKTLGTDAGPALQALAQAKEGADTMQTLADAINAVDMTKSGLGDFVEALAGKFNGLGDALSRVETANYAGTISDVAKALELNTGIEADKWERILTVIGDKLPSIDTLTSGENSVADFLSAAAQAASELGGEYPGLWETLLTTLGDDAGDALVALAKGRDGAKTLENLKNAANGIQDNTTKWKNFLGALQNVNGLSNLFGNGQNAANTIERLSKALSSSNISSNKADAWDTILSALGDNAEQLADLRGEDVQGTKEWLTGLAEAAKELPPEAADSWEKLFKALVDGIPGLGETEEGKALLESFTAGTGGVDQYAANLAALGISTEGIDDKQKLWLATCKELVKTIPSLASIINTETGEVEGGTEAIKEHIAEWKKAQEVKVYWEAYYQKQRALAEAQGSIYDYRLSAIGARQTKNRLQKEIDEMFGEGTALKIQAYVESGYDYSNRRETGRRILGTSFMSDEQYKAIVKYADAIKGVTEAEAELEAQEEANAQAMQELQDMHDGLVAELGEEEQATDSVTESTSLLTRAASGEEEAMEAVKKAVTDATEALKAMADYQEQVRQTTENTVRSVVNGFREIETPVQKAKSQYQDLKASLDKDLKDGKLTLEEYKKRLKDAEGYVPSVQNMTKGLESQLEYMKEYQALLEQARAKGVSEDILSMLSDGSTESYDYLYALVNTGGNIEELNARYAEVQAEAAKFTDTLTEQQLKTDEAYQSLVEVATKAVNDLNMGEEAKQSVVETVQGIVDGLEEQKANVADEVTAIINEIGRLTKFGSFSLGSGGLTWKLNGSHALGLDYVPFNGYLAELHEGEGILTAEENRVWQNFKYGQASSRNSFDYNALSGAIWDNAPNMGGNVYLDGHTVGKLISDQQANSYRALERSGWRG